MYVIEMSRIGLSKPLQSPARRIHGGTGRLGQLKVPNESAVRCLDDCAGSEDRSGNDNAARISFCYPERKAHGKGGIVQR